MGNVTARDLMMMNDRMDLYSRYEKVACTESRWKIALQLPIERKSYNGQWTQERMFRSTCSTKNGLKVYISFLPIVSAKEKQHVEYLQKEKGR